MNTEILKINYENPENEKIEKAAKILKDGGTVVLPTETVYGLGANALNENAIKKIFEAKGRPSDNPLIVHISNKNDIYKLAKFVPQDAKIVMDKFWPGPLTIILEKKDCVPYITTGGLDTVAIRMPNHNIALKLIETANIPIAAPSANISGKPSPTCAEHVIDDLFGRVDIIIDGGNSSVGVESTVLDLSKEIPMILRPGGITLEQLQEVLGQVEVDAALLNRKDNVIARAPGMKYKHYSPKAEVIIVEGNIDEIIKKINELTIKFENEGKKVGIMATDQTKVKYNVGQVISIGDRNNKENIAANLFTVLRDFDKIGADIVLAEFIESDGIGLAIMNRLTKAAGYNIIKV